LRQGWQKTFAYEATQKSKIGNRQIHNPWQNPSFSKCEIYQSTEFPKEGKEEVLSPSALSDYFKKLKNKKRRGRPPFITSKYLLDKPSLNGGSF